MWFCLTDTVNLTSAGWAKDKTLSLSAILCDKQCASTNISQQTTSIVLLAIGSGEGRGSHMETNGCCTASRIDSAIHLHQAGNNSRWRSVPALPRLFWYLERGIPRAQELRHC